jgi:uncharacterized protein YceH (UPF0502 family)
MSRRIPHLLDPVEVRVLGSLLEKEQTTPDAYPLSLNALVAACNQKTNREPVMELAEDAVAEALERLRQDVLVWRTEGARVERFKQSVDRRWDLDPPAKAVLTLLLLRGPQTAAQLRERCERMCPIATLREMEAVLDRLAAQEEPLLGQLSRRLGQKEIRWSHRLGEAEPEAAPLASDSMAATVSHPPASGAPATRFAPAATASTLADLAARIEALDRRVERLEAALRARPE